MTARRHTGPGITKVKRPLPFASRAVRLTRADDALWELLFARADIVSEGRAEREGARLVYRGSTSIILPIGGLGFDPALAGELIGAAAMDPHLRLRAVRIARTEALVRSPGSLQPAQMDVAVGRCADGIRIDIEVDAVVDEHAARVNGEG